MVAEACSLCEELVEKQFKKPPVEMLVKVGTTDNHELDVFACPNCDGGVVKLATKS